MNGSRSQRTLLTEIMIAVLFFALCATVLMETFATAYRYSTRAGVDSMAMTEAQDLAERLYAAGDRDELLKQSGFVRDESRWVKDGGDYRLEVSMGAEDMPVGMLDTVAIRAFREDALIVELPGARYTPQEEKR